MAQVPKLLAELNPLERRYTLSATTSSSPTPNPGTSITTSSEALREVGGPHFYPPYLRRMNVWMRITSNDLLLSGEIGVSFNVGYAWPKDPDNPLDVEAANRAMVFDMGWFADPMFIDGHYPRDMADRVMNKSLAHGLTESRMPEFTTEEAARILGQR